MIVVFCCFLFISGVAWLFLFAWFTITTFQKYMHTDIPINSFVFFLVSFLRFLTFCVSPATQTQLLFFATLNMY